MGGNSGGGAGGTAGRGAGYSGIGTNAGVPGMGYGGNNRSGPYDRSGGGVSPRYLQQDGAPRPRVQSPYTQAGGRGK